MNLILIAVLLALMALAYQIGLKKSKSVAGLGQNSAALHSRPGYYGLLVALWCGIPAFLVFVFWSVAETSVIRHLVMSSLPAEMAAGLNEQQLNVLMRRLSQIASGFGVNEPTQAELSAAAQLKGLQTTAMFAKIAVVIAIAMAGLAYARQRISATLRARNSVEIVIKVAMALCSVIAILTTVGIVLSMLGEAIRFFSFVSPMDFFFGTRWEPGFSTSGASLGDYGLLPLLWGTLMVAGIALLIAIPIGLMTAIYLAEYASPKVRSYAKPTIEILAGIPTIVYGVFALLVLGPVFANIGDAIGLKVNATSALTAGVVMGIMIIPFISSLSDDIITQVPRAMRDGSLGLGGTKSETIMKVVLPAALPGIVGAFLLAASRAIGETMIVVLAAGNAPALHANPLEAVSTVTVMIVNQLTGDTDFASPQSLVAFALGLTLFTITLGLNVIALYIVRKYREQYD
ncbi:MAG: phosphate ABC transporter permease subunit PstC [Pseudomonadota bacterium]|nr:phosphate ABC transporter permease subunit PstC [Pseudomonadota bacterium]